MSMFFAGRIVPSMKCGSMKISMLLVLAASSTCCDAFVMPTSSRIVSPGGQVTVTGTVTYTNTNRNMNMNIVRVAMAKEEVDDDAIYVADFMSKMKSGFMDDSTSEDDDDDDETDEYYEEDGDDDERPSKPTRTSRYDQLSPLGKSRFQKEAVDRKLANNRSESKADKKRKMMFFVKESQRARKKASRIDRKIPLNMRTPLAALTVGADMRGTVISLTTFGAYVDIGTTVDGLLHVSQLSRTKFISHPKEMLSPGDEVVVTVASVNPPLKKLHLTMLSKEAMVLERDLSNADRMALEEIAPDDELWGQVVRVTDFGSYVDVGAVVQGFLHFMDHPLFENGAHPSTFMEVNQRVRVWVSDVDRDQERIKLTANRPDHLPGPRRELF